MTGNDTGKGFPISKPRIHCFAVVVDPGLVPSLYIAPAASELYTALAAS